MSQIREILGRYTAGDVTLEWTNRALEDAGAGFRLVPGRNELTEAEQWATTVGYFPQQANGFGLLDTGTGSMEKVQVKHGVLVNCDCGGMRALFSIAGKTYRVQGSTLTK